MKKRIIKGIIIICALISIIGGMSISSNAKEALTGKSAVEITQMMGKGWNLGNSLDAEGGNKSDVLSHEQAWGNPVITKELIDGVKAAGFNTIRIPTTWYNYVDVNNNYKIDEAYLARVKEVVDYAYNDDMFVIINVHHESWVNDKDIDKNYVKIGEELEAIWFQIADTFADYDEHLIFEGMNEPRAKGTSYEWTGNQACYEAINYLNQIFVSTIRENAKGNNANRALMIPGYAASSNPNVLKAIELPKINGEDAQNLVISVHCYSPYKFCLSDEQSTFDPKNTNDTNDITSLINNLNSIFIKKGVPVVIGECGATNTKDNTAARVSWCKYISEITKKNGIPAILWDNGSIGNDGGERHNYFYRKTGEMYYPEILNSFIYGNTDGNEIKNLYIDFEPYKEGEETILATPEQYGFSPKIMAKKQKVNHTEDAKIGYSAVVSIESENSYATMDISKYAGKAIDVDMFIKSKSSDVVSVGIIDGAEKEYAKKDINEEWTEIKFSAVLGEDDNDKLIYFRGAGNDNFYIDDIAISMKEKSEAGFGAISVVAVIVIAAIIVAIICVIVKKKKNKVV